MLIEIIGSALHPSSWDEKPMATTVLCPRSTTCHYIIAFFVGDILMLNFYIITIFGKYLITWGLGPSFEPLLISWCCDYVILVVIMVGQ